MTKLTKAFAADISLADGERAVTAKISTAAVDRDHEVLIPQGCFSKDFERNPVVMVDHQYFGKLPVGKVVALKRNERDLTAKVVFAERPATHPADAEWMPDTLLSLYQQGVMNAFSVGLIPNETRPANERDVQKYGEGVSRIISKWSLLELSVCAIPANQEAVAIAVSKGLMTADLATKAFGYEAKSDAPDPDEMQTCSICHKDYAASDMTDTDDGVVCKGCMEARKCIDPAPAKHVITEIEVPPAAPTIAKHVLEEMDVPEPTVETRHVVCAIDATPAPAEPTYRVHHVIHEPERKSVNLRKLVVCEMHKRRGRLSQV